MQTKTQLVRPFHEVLAARIHSLDVMQPESIALAQRIVEDVTTTKIPANKIESVYGDFQRKMTEMHDAGDNTFVEQIFPALQQADAGFKAQIEYYRATGDLVTDDTEQLELPDPAIANQALHDGKKLNGHADPLGR